MEEMENGAMPAGQPAQESTQGAACEAGAAQGAQGAAAPAWEDTPPLGGGELKQITEAANRAQDGRPHGGADTPAHGAQGEGIPGGKPPVPNEVWKTARLRAEREAAARYGRGTADYLNCPFDKAGYEAFYEALVSAERAPLHEFDGEPGVYEGCMPIEVMARRGADTMRYGPLRPVGLTNPATGRRPWANVQLRAENAAGTLYNLVGFQTNLKFGEQKRVFSMIPGLENAEFARYGVMHRNTFLNSPRVLTAGLCLKARPDIFFAGQITGFEGYMESAASGLLAARAIAARLAGRPVPEYPAETMCGALLRYITSPSKDFQPMGANMGILPPLEVRVRDKRQRYLLVAQRAVQAMRAALAAG